MHPPVDGGVVCLVLDLEECDDFPDGAFAAQVAGAVPIGEQTWLSGCLIMGPDGVPVDRDDILGGLCGVLGRPIVPLERQIGETDGGAIQKDLGGPERHRFA